MKTACERFWVPVKLLSSEDDDYFFVSVLHSKKIMCCLSDKKGRGVCREWGPCHNLRGPQSSPCPTPQSTSRLWCQNLPVFGWLQLRHITVLNANGFSSNKPSPSVALRKVPEVSVLSTQWGQVRGANASGRKRGCSWWTHFVQRLHDNGAYKLWTPRVSPCT